jgi:DNA-binding winged helix-turn-helix (wHTH) protein
MFRSNRDPVAGALMDQSPHKALRFDRFTLDLTRGFLREGGQDIDLRPKAFQVLCHLASNAGRLVSKRELFEAVWPAVTVSDDSLVQCIRELRDKMGDHHHRLIRTLHRRGYLLDAEVTETAPLASGDGSPRAVSQDVDAPHRAPPFSLMKKWHRSLAAAGLSAAMLGIAYVYMLAPFAQLGPTHLDVVEAVQAPPRAPVANELLGADDARRITELAIKKQLPLPAFQIEKTAGDVRDADRRFVGVWISEVGWLGSFRQMMLIVTSVNADGTADGYAANGPPQTKSHLQSPSRHWPLRMQISGDSITFGDGTGEFEGTLTPQNKMALKVTFRDRVKTGWVLLEPVWTLVTAERPQAAETIVR